MPAPFEIIVGPADVYVAPVGTAFPDVDEAPGVAWDLVGTLGDESYGEKGVLVRSSRTASPVNVLGSTMPRKHTITEVGFQVEFDVIDATAEQMALGYGLDPDDIVDTAAASGSPGDRAFDLPTSPIPFQRAVLVRVDQSPYMEGGKMQFEIYAANQVGNVEAGFTKGEPLMVTHIWEAIKTSSGAVTIRAQDAAAGT
ncbi:MAG: hypothetical protein ACSLE9_08005 [Burkholderiaceae bacterium]